MNTDKINAKKETVKIIYGSTRCCINTEQKEICIEKEKLRYLEIETEENIFTFTNDNEKHLK